MHNDFNEMKYNKFNNIFNGFVCQIRWRERLSWVLSFTFFPNIWVEMTVIIVFRRKVNLFFCFPKMVHQDIGLNIFLSFCVFGPTIPKMGAKDFPFNSENLTLSSFASSADLLILLGKVSLDLKLLFLHRFNNTLEFPELLSK